MSPTLKLKRISLTFWQSGKSYWQRAKLRSSKTKRIGESLEAKINVDDHLNEWQH